MDDNRSLCDKTIKSLLNSKVFKINSKWRRRIAQLRLDLASKLLLVYISYQGTRHNRSLQERGFSRFAFRDVMLTNVLEFRDSEIPKPNLLNPISYSNPQHCVKLPESSRRAEFPSDARQPRSRNVNLHKSAPLPIQRNRDCERKDNKLNYLNRAKGKSGKLPCEESNPNWIIDFFTQVVIDLAFKQLACYRADNEDDSGKSFAINFTFDAA